MRKIGFFGGSSLCEIGSISDVDLFFDCIREFPMSKFPERNWNILNDRLYKKYIRFDELLTAEMMMADVREVFSSIPKSAVNWEGLNNSSSSLNLNGSTLVEIFNIFFENFLYCKQSVEIFFEEWKIYQPVRIVVADMPEFMVEKKRSLEDYDMLDGMPFWKLRKSGSV